MSEYENFQKTNLEYYPKNYADWMFCREIKEENERNASTTEKIGNFIKINFDKFLVKICGNKDRAIGVKMCLIFGVVVLNETRKKLLKNKIISGLAIAVLSVCCIFCI
jgi:hypothetical protein